MPRAKEKAAADALAAAQKMLKAKPADAALKKKGDEADESGAGGGGGDKDRRRPPLCRSRRASEGAEKALRDRRRTPERGEDGNDGCRGGQKRGRTTIGQKRTPRRLKACFRSVLWLSRPTARSWQRPATIRPSNCGTHARAAHLGSETGHRRRSAAWPFIGNSRRSSPRRRISRSSHGTRIRPGALSAASDPKPDLPLETSGSSFAGRVLCLAFNPQGTLLATGGGEPSRSGELKLWNVSSLDSCARIQRRP